VKITKGQLRQIIREEIEKVNEWSGVTGGRAENPGSPYAQAAQTRSKFGQTPDLHAWQIIEIRDQVLADAGIDQTKMNHRDGKRILDHMFMLGGKTRDKESRQAMQDFLDGQSFHMQSPEVYELLAQFRK
jgi:hypothetical protein